jgi:hypothetical protein
MEHRQAEGRQATSYRASGDDSARFLRELRQLRDGAGLGPAELAARAHYPYDRIRAAEVGPSLPDLPVLSAYVRGCGGTTEEWEERWRSLTSAPTLPLHGARPAGSSTAASAGARIGSISPAADTPDPSLIMAALDRVAEEMAVVPSAPPTPSAPLPSRSGVSTIEERPGVEPAAPKSAGGKAGTGTATAWESTAARTAWSPAPAPTAWEAGQSAALAESAAAAAAATAPVAEPVAGNAELAGSPTAARATTDSGRTGTSGRSGASRPVAAATSATSATVKSATVRAPSGPAAAGQRSASGRRSQSHSHSRTTTAALIVIAVCLLAAVLAIFV